MPTDPFHEILRTAIIGGVGALLSVMAWLIKGKVSDMASEIRGAVDKINQHATEIARLDLRVGLTELEVRRLRDKVGRD